MSHLQDVFLFNDDMIALREKVFPQGICKKFLERVIFCILDVGMDFKCFFLLLIGEVEGFGVFFCFEVMVE